jgi:hypothetical protein
MGESDISYDGDHFVFAGDGRYVFTYRISAGAKSAAFDTGGRTFDSVYITPNNNVILSWETSGTVHYTGQELFDGNMNFLSQVGRADGHIVTVCSQERFVGGIHWCPAKLLTRQKNSWVS